MNLDDQMSRCQLDYCKRRDFLPFLCTLCERKFCLEHKDLKAHECPFEFAEKKATQCPKCKAIIQYHSTQYESDVLKKHICEKAKKEESRCLQCKVKLTEINKYHCPHCHSDVCLKHRMQEDHVCKQGGCCIIW